MAIISAGSSDPRVIGEAAKDVGHLGAIAAWRATKGIYKYDPDLLVNLIETPISGQLPVDVLYHLPEWCVYIDFGDISAPENGWPRGFFAHLEWDANTGRTELRLLVDMEMPGVGMELWPIPIHLIDGGTFDDAIKAAYGEALWQYASSVPRTSEEVRAVQAVLNDHQGVIKQLVPPLVSVLLYLCTESADVRGRDEAEPPTHTRRRSPQYAAQSPAVWDVGVRIGAALRRAQQAAGESLGGTHASPKPHVRRAHWHTYWTGPRDNQEPQLKWLSPILVGAENEDGLVPTIRRVE